MPLKTYLPDGDIDLTALCTPNGEESLPQDVLAIFREEEQNENAEYEVKGTQFIDAEVIYVLNYYCIFVCACGEPYGESSLDIFITITNFPFVNT